MTCAGHPCLPACSASGSSSSSMECPRSSPASRSPHSAATSPPTPPQATAACPTPQTATPTGCQVRGCAGRGSGAAAWEQCSGIGSAGGGPQWLGHAEWGVHSRSRLALTLAPAPPHPRCPAGETPSCVIEPNGGCDITKPTVEAFCGTGSEGCPRYDTVKAQYTTVGAGGRAGRQSVKTGGRAAALAC